MQILLQKQNQRDGLQASAKEKLWLKMQIDQSRKELEKLSEKSELIQQIKIESLEYERDRLRKVQTAEFSSFPA
ncbi:MAG: hypothetical protein HC913_04070 [Microscillaceae bacterium]|nr:hypothetical protein [Microscillaceae bacterium]